MLHGKEFPLFKHFFIYYEWGHVHYYSILKMVLRLSVRHRLFVGGKFIIADRTTPRTTTTPAYTTSNREDAEADDVGMILL